MRLPAAAALASLTVLAAGCGASQVPIPVSTPKATTAAANPSTLALSDTSITAPDSQAFFLFQTAGDARLRGVSWDGSIEGLFTRSGRFGFDLQSPDGRYVVIDGMLLDRHGRALGPFPWPGKDMSATWSPDSTVMCKAVPSSPVTGTAMMLQMATPGGRPRTVAQGFAVYSDNAAYPVLACDPHRDRAIVADLGQGIALSQVWVIQLSTHRVLRAVNPAPNGYAVAASSDATLLAITTSGGSPAATTSIQAADSGAVLGSIANFEVHGFSGDGSVLMGLTTSNHLPALTEWRTGRQVWTARSGRYFGHLAAPVGANFVVGFIAPDGTLGDAYLVRPAEAPFLLPSGIAAGLWP